ncbi:MAG: hypothetical protein JSV15_07160 [Candidatus Bathyarchaeota archaeon]|nr:MAG: hypothetical protein JSV15_07160 [Candidatus Bathyarchaeota archaeon]
MKLKDLTEIEKKTYEFIKKVGEIQSKNMPDRRMVGAVINLKNKGLVEIYKRHTGRYRRKKKKFVKVKEPQTKTPQNVYPP